MAWAAAGRVPTGFSPTTNNALSVPCIGSGEHVGQRSAGAARQFFSPHCRNAFADGLVIERGRAWEKFGHGAHFNRALIVVLFGERPEPATGLVEFAEQYQQVQEIRDGVLPARLTQYAVSNQDDQPFCRGQCLRGLCPLGSRMTGGRFQGFP